MDEKIIKLSTKSWHYKLIKFIFGGMLPEPKTMKNLCPYFWMLIASILVVPFIGPIKVIIQLIWKSMTVIVEALESLNDKYVVNWIDKLTDAEAYAIYEEGTQWNDLVAVPKTVKRNMTSFYILKRWAKRYNIDENTPNFEAVVLEAVKKHESEYLKLRDDRYKQEDAARLRIRERRRKREEKEARIQARLDAFGNVFKPAVSSIRKTFTFNSVSSVVKITKQVVGVLLTVLIACALYFVVQLITLGVLALIGIWNWAVVGNFVAVFGVGVLLVGVGFVIGWLIVKLINHLEYYYKAKGSLPWYIQMFVYLGMYIYIPCKYIIWYPLYFIFKVVLWDILCINIVWGILKSFWNAIVSAAGIFGEYFGSSYGDYCPGISFDEEETKK